MLKELFGRLSGRGQGKGKGKGRGGKSRKGGNMGWIQSLIPMGIIVVALGSMPYMQYKLQMAMFGKVRWRVSISCLAAYETARATTCMGGYSVGTDCEM